MQSRTRQTREVKKLTGELLVDPLQLAQPLGGFGLQQVQLLLHRICSIASLLQLLLLASPEALLVFQRGL